MNLNYTSNMRLTSAQVENMSSAFQADDAFAPYYGHLMPVLKQATHGDTGWERKWLTGVTCLTLAAWCIDRAPQVIQNTLHKTEECFAIFFGSELCVVFPVSALNIYSFSCSVPLFYAIYHMQQRR